MDEELAKKKLLVTGAAGYLGGRLCSYLSTQGYLIIRGVRSNCGDDLSQQRNFQTIEFDVRDEEACLLACKGVDYVVHLAALNERECVKDVRKAIEVNCIGSQALFKACVVNNVRKVVYFSTAHVYGALEGMITEGTVCRPFHPYSYSHHMSEHILRSYCVDSGLSGVSLRLSNSYGSPASASVNRWTLLINDLCRQAVTNKVLKLHSSGSQKRDFIGLKDVCRAVHHVLSSDYFNNSSGEVFNLGGNLSLSVFEVAHIIADKAAIFLGEDVRIETPQSQAWIEDLAISNFSYSSDLFAQSGFKWMSDMNREIDELLQFCSKNFL